MHRTSTLATPTSQPTRQLPGTPTLIKQDGYTHVVLVAGYAGSGKSEFSKRVAEGLAWPVLDKDVMTGPLVEGLIGRISGDPNDRHSPAYLTLVRPLEYQGLLDATLDNVRAGVSVVVTAPFLQELQRPQWVTWLHNALKAHGARLHIVWVDCDEEMMRARITQRGAGRDTWKLANWSDYIADINPAPYRNAADQVVDNTLEAFTSLDEAASRFIASVAAPLAPVRAPIW
ncbi:ATP-binding protein [Curtobacterium sp. MCBD17_040]|uniref:AAA family ATPase n=1 Tax=Curtobacterium sp. MCBD17_040 TaxID=2175674 RepID=UPI0015E8EA8E|nr:ATP-binding protein [Curtobacterium sp. MCBD17_040]WIB65410.1 ATP-binding protein [Curtobacterium sp. MCBD17_040]